MTLGAGELDALRGRAFAIAYRMLGTVSEAEDLVQEALLRLHRVHEAGERIASPRAYVATVVTRLAIDHLRSARVRRERYVGDWLPEPVVEPPAAEPGRADADPATRAEMVESLSIAFLAVLERLSPEQRAALLLRDVFQYEFAEIAEILGKSRESVRQLAVRARRHVREQRPRFEVSRAQRDRLAASFFRAIEAGDMAALEATLARDVVLRGDGGGKAAAIPAPVIGREHVARTLLAWVQLGRRIGGVVRAAIVNGGPGGTLHDRAGRLLGVWAMELAGDGVVAISSVVNPDKLRHLGEVGWMDEELRRASAALPRRPGRQGRSYRY